VRWRSVLVRSVVPLGVALVLTGCGGSATEPGQSDGKRFIEGTGEIMIVASAERKAAPDLRGTTLDGKPLALADYRGKVVVLNVWASWCAPCRAEAPGMERIYRSERSKGVEFVGIDTRDQPDNARAFVRNFSLTYPSLVDSGGQMVLQFKGTLPPNAIPTTLILDRQGRIAVRALKPLTEEELRRALDPVVAEPA
jgi:thiol-disulfide isomerase/thioredoxin